AVTYVPALKGSGYENVSIKNILQMSSGARWLEEYGNPDSEIARLGRAMATGSSLVEFVAKIQNELEPGTFNRYSSADTQVLGLILEAATGQSMADYTQAKLWKPLGANHDAYWNTDNDGNAMAFAGFNATARDYARIGEAFRLNGKFNGKQVIPADWVQASITPDAPHLMPGTRDNSDASMGYGYQWWIPEGDEQDYCAIGIRNQFMCISPKHDTVIVKLSASRNYASAGDETSWREYETIGLLREIAGDLDGHPSDSKTACCRVSRASPSRCPKAGATDRILCNIPALRLSHLQVSIFDESQGRRTACMTRSSSPPMKACSVRREIFISIRGVRCLPP